MRVVYYLTEIWEARRLSLKNISYVPVIRLWDTDLPMIFIFPSECEWMVPGTVDPNDD